MLLRKELTNMDTSINFKGAIVLNKPTPRISRMIRTVVGAHHQKFDNFLNEGDVLYIVRNGKDKEVAEFLSHHRTPFTFYTGLSTKSGFDNTNPSGAKQILDDCKSKIITAAGELKEHFGLNKRVQNLPILKRNAAPETSLRALGYRAKDTVIKKRNGYSEIYDNNGKLLAKVSGPGQYGISFAFVEPKNADGSPLRYALRGSEIIFEYTSESGRMQFLKNYNEAVKVNKFVPKSAQV